MCVFCKQTFMSLQILRRVHRDGPAVRQQGVPHLPQEARLEAVVEGGPELRQGDDFGPKKLRTKFRRVLCKISSKNGGKICLGQLWFSYMCTKSGTKRRKK
jgi:hypothetical protein